MKGLKRSVLGDESFFVTKYIAPSEGGWVDVAARLPGDVSVLAVDGSVNLTRGSWLCSSGGVEINTKWDGFKNLTDGEGGFLVHATGQGEVVAAYYGALDRFTLEEGETQILDSGHLVAFNEGLDYTTRTVAKGPQGDRQELHLGGGVRV